MVIFTRQYEGIVKYRIKIQIDEFYLQALAVNLKSLSEAYFTILSQGLP